MKHLKAARKNNKQAKIRGFKLEINKKVYSVEELENPDLESEFYSHSDGDADVDEEEEESNSNQKPTEKKKEQE
ncbi:hypothetical protein JTB14_023109 [Gonioctena quinquepunctata]|nr:hypothetical protein JTB14_023109 [Gonioctena quinquepunctata]